MPTFLVGGSFSILLGNTLLYSQMGKFFPGPPLELGMEEVGRIESRHSRSLTRKFLLGIEPLLGIENYPEPGSKQAYSGSGNTLYNDVHGVEVIGLHRNRNAHGDSSTTP